MNNKKREAGKRQESQVSYFLHRLLGKDKNFRILENLLLPMDGFNSQIDHLVLYRGGFFIIESKSIYGSVRVNSHKEWERSYQNKWFGIPSPVKQAEVQISTLKAILNENKKDIIGKMPILGFQQGFGGRQYIPIIAVSSSTILEREMIPTEISKNIVKTEFLVDRIKEISGKHTSKSFFKSLADSVPLFSDIEMESIYDFLQRYTVKSSQADKSPGAYTRASSNKDLPPKEKKPDAEPAQDGHAGADVYVSCKKCYAKEGLTGHFGRYGYYATCSACSTNTPLKSNCPKCRSTETKTRKSKQDLFVDCQGCGHQAKLSVKWES